MKKLKPIDILSNPFFLAAIFILPAVIYFEITLPRYVSETINTMYVTPGQVFHYDDLDGDGGADLIRTKHNIKGVAAVVVEMDDKILGQFDLGGKFRNSSNYTFIGDYNSDGKKEIFTFTHADAKIWLNQLDAFDTIQPPKKKKIFIDSVWVKDGEYDFTQSFYGLYDMNGDGAKELIFNISAGFSVYPRKVYYYDIKNDTLIKSVAYGACASISQIADIDGDSLPEVLMNTQAINNMMGKYDLPYSDGHSWIMVFDHKLQFKFEPTKSGGVHSFSKVNYIKTQDKSLLVAALISQGKGMVVKPRPVVLKKLDVNGKVKDVNTIKILDFNIRHIIDPENCLLFFEQDKIFTIDTLLRKIKLKKNKQLKKLYPKFSPDYKTGIYQMFQSSETGGIFFVDATFEQFIPVNVIGKYDKIFQVSQLEPIHNNPHFAIQTDEEVMRFIIKKSPHYVYRFGYYGGGYVVLLVFILTIQWLQRRQLNKQFEIERTISKLRFRAIKNEISPHFTLNVLNSIVALAYKGEPEKVFEHSMKFSKLIQASLLDSEKMTRALEEELEFVKNYLELQKLRFGDKIRYQYEIDENVDLSMIVPKMVIHTYTENAMKHGLALLEKDGLLKIIIHQTDHYLDITIDDNGVGREQTRKTKSGSTGKGQKIMQEYYQIFNAKNEQKITCEIIDKEDEIGKPTGTRVVVKIPVGYRYVL